MKAEIDGRKSAHRIPTFSSRPKLKLLREHDHARARPGEQFQKSSKLEANGAASQKSKRGLDVAVFSRGKDRSTRM